MRKNVLTPIAVLLDADLSESQESIPVHIQWLDNMSVQVILGPDSEDAAGTFTVEVTNDFALNADGSVRRSENWVALPLDPSLTVSAGAPTALFADINQSGAVAMRVTFEPEVGSEGTATVLVAGKAI